MARRVTKSVLVRMPAELKRRLASEVASREATLNDIVGTILAERFGAPFEPSNRKGRPPGDGSVVLLRIPPALKERIQAVASANGETTNKVVVDAVAESLGMATDGLSEPRRRTRPRAQARQQRRKHEMSQSNGHLNGKPGQSDKVRVALIGVGNCANSLLQGIEYYRDADPDQFVPGLMNVDLGGYHVSDIEFTAAFDVTTDKVGKDLADAIWAKPNDTYKFAKVPKTGITVSRGMTHDGLGKYLSEVVEKADGETSDVVGILKETGTDVVVNYLPVGSEQATKWYTEQILNAGCAMVNCMPVFIAREGYWQGRFTDAGVPIIGDDIKSQVGATIAHRVLTSLFRERGVHLDRTMQLNVGGNSDFLNMLERDRLESKKISKTNAVTSMLDYDIGEENVPRRPIGLRALADGPQMGVHPHGGLVLRRRSAQHRAQARGLGLPQLGRHRHRRRPPHKLALDHGVAGALEGPSAYLMKSPPKQIQDDDAHDLVEKFIAKHPRKREGKAHASPPRAPSSKRA